MFYMYRAWVSAFTLHAVQRTHIVASDALGGDVIGISVTFFRNTSGLSLRATRLLARTVSVKGKAESFVYNRSFTTVGTPCPAFLY